MNLPNNNSSKKRLKTAEKSAVLNRSVRSEIRTSLKKLRTATVKEDLLKEIPHFFSIIDKASNKSRAGFKKNRVGNYKRKVSNLLNAFG